MGFGDELVASGLARGARARGKRIAFGFGGIIRRHFCGQEIFRWNPNVAPPGSERDSDIEWIPHCPGARLNTSGIAGDCWRWLPFRPPPGEIFFDEEEERFGRSLGKGFVVMEPRVKAMYPNKQWPQERYREVAGAFARKGLRVFQFVGAADQIPGCGIPVLTPTFRKALAMLSHAALYVGAEGGMHHGAAAVGTKAVVLFGGWPDPKSSGYDCHVNLASDDAGCGRVGRCPHCRDAMDKITVDQVLGSAFMELGR